MHVAPAYRRARVRTHGQYRINNTPPHQTAGSLGVGGGPSGLSPATSLVHRRRTDAKRFYVKQTHTRRRTNGHSREIICEMGFRRVLFDPFNRVCRRRGGAEARAVSVIDAFLPIALQVRSRRFICHPQTDLSFKMTGLTSARIIARLKLRTTDGRGYPPRQFTHIMSVSDMRYPAMSNIVIIKKVVQMRLSCVSSVALAYHSRALRRPGDATKETAFPEPWTPEPSFSCDRQ